MLGQFMEACIAGDMDGLANLLAEEVTAWMDGGGKVAVTGNQPVRGREQVARGIIRHLSRVPAGMTAEVIEMNGLSALLVRVNGQISSVLTLEVAGGLIYAVRSVINPDKLAHLKLPPTPGREWRVIS
jgi:RNA polymerase sigma-70 factor (ECF subfamily)